MIREDPYSPSGPNRFECENCLTRVETDGTASRCPDCGEPVRNLSVPRE